MPSFLCCSIVLKQLSGSSFAGILQNWPRLPPSQSLPSASLVGQGATSTDSHRPPCCPGEAVNNRRAATPCPPARLLGAPRDYLLRNDWMDGLDKWWMNKWLYLTITLTNQKGNKNLPLHRKYRTNQILHHHLFILLLGENPIHSLLIIPLDKIQM